MRIQIQGLDLALGVVEKNFILVLHERGLGAFPMTLEWGAAMASCFQFGVSPLARADRLILSLKMGGKWVRKGYFGGRIRDL